jgi:hypothetical protein
MTHGLIGLGSWRNLLQPQYPDVACFVDAAWSESERWTVVQYLQQGRPLHHWMGMETCLLGCGQHLPTTGCTDGTYYWPASLVHYLTQHAVRLPPEVVAHIQQQPGFPAAAAATVDERAQADYTWWQLQRGGQPGMSSLRHLGQAEIRDYLRRYDRQQIDYPSVESSADKAALVQMVAELRAMLP